MRDRKYIDRFQEWDLEAFGILYDRYIDQIFAFIYRKTSDRQVAEDICSKVWMKALKSLEFFWNDDNAHFKAWIYCIANNTIIDFYRTRREDVNIDDITLCGIWEDFACHIDAKNRLKDVMKYMDTMKPLEREICILRIWDDLAYRDIAKIIGKKEDACKKMFSRAIAKVRANVALILLCFFMI